MDFSRYLDDPAVLGVFIAGSRASGTADAGSDWDVCVLTDGQVSDALRDEVATSGHPSILNRAPGHFGDGDCWREGGVDVDVMFWDYAWITSELRGVIDDHHVKEGYTTAHWRTVATWQEVGVADPERIQALTELAAQPYSDDLAARIVDHNYRLIRPVLFSYEAQINKALSRGDVVSLNHRIAALVASWFDIVFAVNKVLHPGEKKLLDHLASVDHPEDAEEDLRALCAGAASRLGPFIDRLEAWLEGYGFLK